MSGGAKKLLHAAAGTSAAGGDNLFPEDVFSTFLYAGVNAANTITNGLDLSGEGGLVWCKDRKYGNYHRLYDTERGVNKYFDSASATAQGTNSASGTNHGIDQFNSNGFRIGGQDGSINDASSNFTSWSWRKAKGFFDVVTYTGSGSARTIAHNLGSVPKMIIVKSISDDYNFYVYHASLTNQQNLTLDTTSQAGNSGDEYWNSTTATSSVFSLGTYFGVNGASKTYVAYVFGDDASFGEDGDEQICKMGSFTPTGSGTAKQTINLGFEPQWLIIKNSTSSQSGGWWIFDNMRGFTAGDGNGSEYLLANTSGAASAFGAGSINITNQGFEMVNNAFVSSSQTFIYMAIRRPMKVPEAGTEVFIANEGTPSAGQFVTGFPVDLNINTIVNSANNRYALTRLLGNGNYLKTEDTSAEATIGSTIMFNNGNANTVFDLHTNFYGSTSNPVISWSFKRASKFMDVVAFSGTGANPLSVSHNLTVPPELMIAKRRNGAVSWMVGVPSVSLGGFLNTTDNLSSTRWNTDWSGFSPTSTIFKVSDGTAGSGDDIIAYLFATLDGISKVGSVGHSGTTNVDCGFSNGARFVLVKRTDSTGDWYAYDSVRGIVAGNDPYKLLNTVSDEVTNTDYIDPLSSGFTLSDDFTDGTYIFLAIA